ncbi:ABC transporter ATP-binding protein [bacterium]|nr:ABC transporter ATP-binding protein [bacterium]
MNDHGGCALHAEHLSHHYGQRTALDDVSLDIGVGETFALLGPNGGGKTTLFKLLSTSMPVQAGTLEIFGIGVRNAPLDVRRQIGVVFQSPSLDKKLSVRENLLHHARLYGMARSEYLPRMEETLSLLGLADRLRDRVEQLSGGLARRVEIAKSLLHGPRLLILDEPSTGLDPAARSDLWKYLASLKESGVTLLTTTHLMDEAEQGDRVGILHQGKLVALGSPAVLRSQIGGEVVSIHSAEPDALANMLLQHWEIKAEIRGGLVRFEHPTGFDLLPEILDFARGKVESLSVSRPTLEDVFLQRTGHRFWGDIEHG